MDKLWLRDPEGAAERTADWLLEEMYFHEKNLYTAKTTERDVAWPQDWKGEKYAAGSNDRPGRNRFP